MNKIIKLFGFSIKFKYYYYLMIYNKIEYVIDYKHANITYLIFSQILIRKTKLMNC